MKEIKIWIRATRAPFFQATIIPVLVGGVIAWYETSQFSWLLFLITLSGSLAIHSGTNLANDYFDHLSKNDEINLNVTPFSGGSRIIQEKVLKPESILNGSLISFFIALVIGLYLTYLRGWPVIIFGLIGIILGYFYTASPLKLGYRGYGEFAVGILLGPMIVLGVCYVMTGMILQLAVYASLPVGLLVAGILYINEFPDYEADKAVGKNHLIVRLGLARAAIGYLFLIILIYLSILVPVLLKITPWLTLIAFLTFPIALNNVKIALQYYDHPRKIIPAQAGTIKLHLLIGLLISISFVTHKLIF